LTEQAAPAFEAAVPILSQLVKAETAEREVRSVAYQLKAARLPAYRDLNGFDFSSSEVNEALVRQLHRCEFIDEADNIVLIGGPAQEKLISRPPSACKPSSTIASASSRPSNRSMRSIRRKHRADPDRSPIASFCGVNEGISHINSFLYKNK
jgi:hypothetical protein